MEIGLGSIRDKVIVQTGSQGTGLKVQSAVGGGQNWSV